jgi:transcriptional regulator with XRE-family HTH domain
MRKVDPPAFDFVKCSAILRELRISQKLTHSALAASTGINRQSLIDYEKATLRQGIPTGEKPDRTLSVKGMSINHLCKLAEFYDVSAEYLLGLSDVKTAVPDLRAMCEYTGLSEEALQNLKRFNSAEAYSTQSETILRIPKLINSLFEHYEAFFI